MPEAADLEVRILLAIHAWSDPFLDRLFLLSHLLGTAQFCIALVAFSIARHLRRNDRAEATLWLAVGLLTFLVQEWLKIMVGRPRPSLWPPLVVTATMSFPSGHALASATFYPLLARDWAQARPKQAKLAYATAIALALYIGFGRLYLGVHWPTDVLAGWAMGAGQTIIAVRQLRRWKPS